MPRRPSVSCRQFRHQHAEYVDGFLSLEQVFAMRQHLDDCAQCAALDVRVRRSLLALQTLPMIEPSADFRERLRARLAQRDHLVLVPRRASGVRWGVAAFATAASAVFLLVAAPTGRSAPAPVRLEAIAAVPPDWGTAPEPAPGFEMVALRRATPSFEPLPVTVAMRRGPMPLSTPTVRLQLATFPAQ